VRRPVARSGELLERSPMPMQKAQACVEQQWLSGARAPSLKMLAVSRKTRGAGEVIAKVPSRAGSGGESRE